MNKTVNSRETEIFRSYPHILEKTKLKYNKATVYKYERKNIYYELTGDETLHLVSERHADEYMERRKQIPDTVIYFDNEKDARVRLVYEGFFNI